MDFNGDKISSTPSFVGGGSKAVGPISEDFWGMLKNPAEYERHISSAKITAISSQVSLDLLLSISAGLCQRALLDESRMIRTQMETHNRSDGHRAWDALYDTTSLQLSVSLLYSCPILTTVLMRWRNFVKFPQYKIAWNFLQILHTDGETGRSIRVFAKFIYECP
jgi:hypothetical protein